MNARGDRSFLSRPAVAVAAASSCALVVVAALDGLGAPVIALALGLACTLAVVSHREAKPHRLPHTLQPLEGSDGPAAVRAPKASRLAPRHDQSQTDAA